jgi:predicted amidohydrolase
VPESPNFIALALEWETWLQKYRSLARELHINIVPGTIVQAFPNPDPDSSSGDSTNLPLLNISTFISDEGEILGSYTKLNLWHPERQHLTGPSHSTPHSVITTPLGPIGILVCWDLAFPEAFRALIRQGAKIIIIPSFWTRMDCSEEGLKRNPDSEALFLETTLTARAFENTACIVFVNAGGESEGGPAGLSQVSLPFVGKVKGSFEGHEEGMKVVEVDMEILEEAERNYKVREDLGRQDWHYGYSHSER